jgi:hypothetical protein
MGENDRMVYFFLI